MGITFPAYATALEMDRKFKFWLCRLHTSLDWREPHPTSTPVTLEERSRAYQRHLCAGYYLAAQMNLHRPYLMHAPPILPPPKPLSATMTVIMNPSRERCIELAMELVRVMCDAQEEAAQWEPDRELPALLFHYAYFTFDGVIAIAGAFSQEPPHPKAEECLALIDRALRMLQWCVSATRDVENRDGEGETAARAITTIGALRKAGQWDERFRKDRAARAARKANGQNGQNGNGSARNSNSPPEPATERPAQEQVFPQGVSLTDPSLFGGLTYNTPETTNPIPFLTTGSPFPGFSFPGLTTPAQTTSATMPMLFGGGGDARDFGSMPSGSSGMDTAATNGALGTASMQTMGMPFDMLHGAESFDVDWSAFAEIQGWPVNGLFDSTS